MRCLLWCCDPNTSNKCIATSNKCITTSIKKLLVAKCIATSSKKLLIAKGLTTKYKKLQKTHSENDRLLLWGQLRLLPPHFLRARPSECSSLGVERAGTKYICQAKPNEMNLIAMASNPIVMASHVLYRSSDGLQPSIPY